MEILLISVVNTMLQKVKYGVDYLKDYWSEELSIKGQEQVKYWLFLNVLLLMSPLSTYVHECGHAFVGGLFGLQLLEFTVGLSGGRVKFEYLALMELSPLQIYLVYVAGGVAESLMYYVLGRKVFEGFYAGIIITLPYGLWEGIRGLILLMEPSEAIQLLHAAALGPVLWISSFVGVGILAYRALYPSGELD